MISIKQPGQSYSAYWNGVGTSLTRGQFVKPAGKAAASYGGGGPKYANTGDPLVTLAVAADTLLTPVYPVNKLLFKVDGADTSNDTIASGEYLGYYQGGQYETDVYGTIFAGAAFGAFLFLDANSKLTTTTGGAAVGMIIEHAGTNFDSNYLATGLLWYEHFRFPVVVSGQIALPN